MKILIHKITLTTISLAFTAFVAHAQTRTALSRGVTTGSSGLNPTPSLIIIGTQVISPAETPATSSTFSPATGQQNRGLGMGQQGTGMGIGQQGTTLIGPPPVFPPPSPVPQAPAPVLTPPAPALNTPSPVITPQAIQPAIPPQGVGPVIPPETPPQNLTPLPPPEARGLGIGQQGSGTSIGQQGTTQIGPQQNTPTPGQQGTTPVTPPAVNENGTTSQPDTTSRPQQNFSAINLQSTAILGPPGSFSTSSQLPLLLNLPSSALVGTTTRTLTPGTPLVSGHAAASYSRSAPAAARSAAAGR